MLCQKIIYQQHPITLCFEAAESLDRIAVASYHLNKQESVQVLNISNGTSDCHWQLKTKNIQGLFISSNGKRLAIVTDEQVSFYNVDLKSKKALWTIPDVQGLRFHPLDENKVIYLSSKTQDIILANIDQQILTIVTQQHPRSVTFPAFATSPIVYWCDKNQTLITRHMNGNVLNGIVISNLNETSQGQPTIQILRKVPNIMIPDYLQNPWNADCTLIAGFKQMTSASFVYLKIESLRNTGQKWTGHLKKTTLKTPTGSDFCFQWSQTNPNWIYTFSDYRLQFIDVRYGCLQVYDFQGGPAILQACFSGTSKYLITDHLSGMSLSVWGIFCSHPKAKQRCFEMLEFVKENTPLSEDIVKYHIIPYVCCNLL